MVAQKNKGPKSRKGVDDEGTDPKSITIRVTGDLERLRQSSVCNSTVVVPDRMDDVQASRCDSNLSETYLQFS